MIFTVEQLELIRKLRESGISSDQVVQAFEEPKVLTPQNNNKLYSNPLLIQQLTSTVPTLHIRTVPSPINMVVKSEVSSSSTSPAPVFEHPICSNAPRPIRSQRTPMKEITTLDDPSELEEFMQNGEEMCIQDMKTFITQYSLRQTTVAHMTGVSQPYISKLLNGNHRELSLRCRKNIYCWYLNCRRHPEKLTAFISDPSTRLETNGDGELIPQRRERYVFRPILIKMLENFFNQTPFPDLPRRVEIATACNHVLQLDKKGVGLMPKEVVSPQVVSNWFANKRKELRRRSAEASAASTSSASSTVSSGSVDVASISSMSPTSRDDENSSRNMTPEVEPSSPLALIKEENEEPATTVTPPTSLPLPMIPTMPSLIPNPTVTSPLELLAIAQQLGLQIPMPQFPGAFLPFPMTGFYSNPAILKSE
ncbi:Protein CBR-HMBX-1 [Caenorhabditis briggsae]|uniref:Protein CBR-HMBX-1 n=3 Tax=Caenorhabditis briggsae TaxID=6238 RepID=A8Y1J4_CAEBR|nr:Protein CBR-HMBX-1 [Caenorhabditis briggsae]ULU09624.1 hypothetical protein L3Y34_014190 [Caenorhabditis briggsae]CAP38763.1 Protein CBR-HMBX-1 [Caenorhabditis briggsae]